MNASLPVTTGVTGEMPVAGGLLQAAWGYARTANTANPTLPTTTAAATTAQWPVNIGGRDSSGYQRDLRLTDQGRVTVSSGVGGITPEGSEPVVVVDGDITDGLNGNELQVLILKELRVLTQQMRDLPFLLNNGFNATDDPADIRQDVSLLN
jgi:hypothetical protein